VTIPARKSELETFIERERPDLGELLDPYREQARTLDVYGQAVLGAWCELAHVAQRSHFLDDGGEGIRSHYASESAGYEPSDPDSDRLIVPVWFGATLNGLAEDLESRRVRVDELQASLEQLHRVLEQAGELHGSIYGGAPFGMVFRDALEAGLEPEEAGPAVACAMPWQRLAWLTECRMRGGAVLARGRAEPIMGDSHEQLAYLLRLAANQPGLGNWPELARFVPKRAEGLLPLSEKAYRRFRREGIPDDPELAESLVEEIINRRHYVLDSMSVIELEELGVQRIVIAPEERPESMVEGYEPAFVAGFLVDHVAGAFAGTITIGGETSDARHANIMVPAILERAGAEIEAETAPEWDDSRDLSAFREAMAAIELLLLSAWRDLVVPDVRDEQYEIDRIRRVKGGGGKRATKRGNLEIIRYIPRRLVYRRAAREAAKTEGGKEPRKLYAVGAFARRLPMGQRRGAEADAFAREIGIPLADHQTVVQPHYRGGTEDERKAAMELGTELAVRRWRSWSALDLLRTRAATPSPEEPDDRESDEAASTVTT
jgi:hypothetical protein